MVVAQPLLDFTTQQVAENRYYPYLPLQQQSFEAYPTQPLFAPGYTFAAGPEFQEPSPKRIKQELHNHASPYGYSPHRTGPMDTSSGANAKAAAEAAIAAASSVNKPKRVRTGCLTCRERHLKCDEGMPVCMNCRKSARECKRGIRLNFIDTTCRRPPTMPMSSDWRINFVDESREIAREYVDGEEQYSRKDSHMTDAIDHDMSTFGYQPAQSSAPMMSQQSIPNMQALQAGDRPMSQQNVNVFAHQEQQQAQQQAQQSQQQQQQTQGMNSGASAFSHASLPTHHSHHSSQQPSPYHQSMRDAKTEPEYQAEAKEILNTQEETLYMQVFVEEVGLWMDSMDSMKHVSIAHTWLGTVILC